MQTKLTPILAALVACSFAFSQTMPSIDREIVEIPYSEARQVFQARLIPIGATEEYNRVLEIYVNNSTEKTIYISKSDLWQSTLLLESRDAEKIRIEPWVHSQSRTIPSIDNVISIDEGHAVRIDIPFSFDVDERTVYINSYRLRLIGEAKNGYTIVLNSSASLEGRYRTDLGIEIPLIQIPNVHIE